MRRAALAWFCSLHVLSEAALAQPDFQVLATDAFALGVDVSVSADGSVAGVAIVNPTVGGARRIELSTLTSTLLALGLAATRPAFSADGSVAMGTQYDFGTTVYRWTPASWVAVPTLYGTIAGLSSDGSRYAGTEYVGMFEQAYVATYAPGVPVLTLLGDLPGGAATSTARGISGDGSIVVGRSEQALGPEAFRWDATNGMVGLGDLADGTFSSEATDVSQDGATIVGIGASGSGTEAFLWQGATMVGLGDLAGGSFASRAFGVSGDGTVVVGSGTLLADGGPASEEAAFVWDAENGMRDLEALLVDGFGLDLDGAALGRATDVSADGYTVVGYGRDASNRPIAWVAVIPEPGASAQLGAGCLALAWLSRRRASAGSRRG